MTPRPTVLLLVALAILVVGATLAVVACEASVGTSHLHGRYFQTFFRGIGFGPALDLSRSERDFDPRVGHVSTERFEPVPAGDAFGPHGAPRVRFP